MSDQKKKSLQRWVKNNGALQTRNYDDGGL